MTTILAYIGPGAGIALWGSFLAVAGALLSAVVFAVTWPLRLALRGARARRARRAAKVARVVVVGLDGLDPRIAERLMDEGRLPNLARLRRDGAYARLATTWPPLSPVAWSSFSTGTNPGKHNIFDFVSRCPRTLRAVPSSVRLRRPERRLRIGPWAIPLGGTRIEGLRRSRPFWSLLGDAGIPCAVIRVPITYPPDRFAGLQLSAMCTPDLRGTHGTHSFFCENGAAPGDGEREGDSGGDVVRVERRGGGVRSFLTGPAHPFRADGRGLRVPFRVEPRGDRGAVLRIGAQRVALEPGTHSPWVRVVFRPAPGLAVRGVCRFQLRSLSPFEMYCTPVQIDPDRPVVPISRPRVLSSYLARLHGPYSTLGLVEDTKALSEGHLSEEAFLEQAWDAHDERERMLFDLLRRMPRGLVACVFDGPDRIQHMFWRYIDPEHPALAEAQRAAHRRVIEAMYERMDDLVGRVLAEIDGRSALLVMSDHGFESFRRGVDLNAWLLDQGYLALRPGAGRPGGRYLADVDWPHTRAYALGLAGIYLNLRGRERDGTVDRADAPGLVRELCARLSGLVDAQTGRVAIREAVGARSVYRGPYVDAAPDVVVGYERGYRVSWDSAVGRCGGAVFQDNRRAWSGDHCVHPALVPGVLFSNRRLDADGAAIVDLAPTALDLLGLPTPPYMEGRSLVCAG